MVFNSLTYICMLIISFGIYWNIFHKNKTKIIFLLSLIFYGFWRVEFIFLILLSVLIDYFVALKIPYSKKETKRKLLYFSITANLSILFIFKYLNFFVENIYNFAILLGFEIDPLLINIILPLGISFYTFQTISYTVDVYRGHTKPEKCFFTYASYVTFFPQLIAGPILRASEIIPQFKQKILLNHEDIYCGLRRIIFGLFLKVALADNISIFVDEGFSIAPKNLSAIDVWTLSFLFGFQIYFDFSAYSHIAIGSARLFGIKFPENFNFPYLSNSPKDFWKRWHISLSSWIRDYLYLPLCNLKSKIKSTNGIGDEVILAKKNKSLFITWCLMGIWHGANWTFLIWGIFHALFLLCYRRITKFTENKFEKLQSFGIILTLPIIMLGWVPFRSQSLNQTFDLFKIIFDISKYGTLNMRENSYLVCAIILILHLLTYFVYKRLNKYFKILSIKLIILETSLFTILFLILFMFLRPINQFIYFQF